MQLNLLFLYKTLDLSFETCKQSSNVEFLLVEYQNQYLDDGQLLNKIARDLDGAVFIYRDNIIKENDEIIAIGYTTVRGYFECTYTKTRNKIIILDTETTVEYLAAYVADTYQISNFYISEGLSKGVFFN